MIRQYAAKGVTVPCPCPTLSINGAKFTRVVDKKGVDVMLSGRPMWKKVKRTRCSGSSMTTFATDGTAVTRRKC